MHLPHPHHLVRDFARATQQLTQAKLEVLFCHFLRRVGMMPPGGVGPGVLAPLARPGVSGHQGDRTQDTKRPGHQGHMTQDTRTPGHQDTSGPRTPGHLDYGG